MTDFDDRVRWRDKDKEAQRAGERLEMSERIRIPMTLVRPLTDGAVCAMTCTLGRRLRAWFISDAADEANPRGLAPELPIDHHDAADLMACLELLRRFYLRVENAKKRGATTADASYARAVSVRNAAQRLLRTLMYAPRLWEDEEWIKERREAGLRMMREERFKARLAEYAAERETPPTPIMRFPAALVPLAHALAGPVDQWPKDRSVWQDIAEAALRSATLKNGPALDEQALGLAKLKELEAFTARADTNEVTDAEYEATRRLRDRVQDAIKRLNARTVTPTPATDDDYYTAERTRDQRLRQLRGAAPMDPASERAKAAGVIRKCHDGIRVRYTDGRTKITVEMPNGDLEFVILPRALGEPDAIQSVWYQPPETKSKRRRAQGKFIWERVDV